MVDADSIITVESNRIKKKNRKIIKYMSNYIVKSWPNGKCLTTKHHQTLFGDQTC